MGENRKNLRNRTFPGAVCRGNPVVRDELISAHGAAAKLKNKCAKRFKKWRASALKDASGGGNRPGSYPDVSRRRNAGRSPQATEVNSPANCRAEIRRGTVRDTIPEARWLRRSPAAVDPPSRVALRRDKARRASLTVATGVCP